MMTIIYIFNVFKSQTWKFLPDDCNKEMNTHETLAQYDVAEWILGIWRCICYCLVRLMMLNKGVAKTRWTITMADTKSYTLYLFWRNWKTFHDTASYFEKNGNPFMMQQWYLSPPMPYLKTMQIVFYVLCKRSQFMGFLCIVDWMCNYMYSVL